MFIEINTDVVSFFVLRKKFEPFFFFALFERIFLFCFSELVSIYSIQTDQTNLDVRNFFFGKE